MDMIVRIERMNVKKTMLIFAGFPALDKFTAKSDLLQSIALSRSYFILYVVSIRLYFRILTLWSSGLQDGAILAPLFFQCSQLSFTSVYIKPVLAWWHSAQLNRSCDAAVQTGKEIASEDRMNLIKISRATLYKNGVN